MELEYGVHNGRYIERIYMGTKYLSKDVELFGSYEEAEKRVDETLDGLDHSAADIYCEPTGEGKFRLDGHFTKKYSYNVLAEKHAFEGFTINLGVIVWNKETGEISYRLMDDDKLDSLISVIPGMRFMKDIVELYKVRFEEMKEEGVVKLRRLINRHSTGYPLSYNYVHSLAGFLIQRGEGRGIESVTNMVYDNYIGSHFRERR